MSEQAYIIDSAEATVLIEGNDIDIGLIARRNQTGFVAVDLGMGADPDTFTPELVHTERLRMGGRLMPDGTIRDSWRFRKEYLRDASAASGQLVFEPEWLDLLQPELREPAYRMDLDISPSLMNMADARRSLPEGYRLPTAKEAYAPGISRDIETHEVILGAAFWSMEVPARKAELRKWIVPKSDGRIACWIRPDSTPAGLPGDSLATRTFAAGADVGEGVGASETTCEVFTGDTREQAAEFGSNRITPGDFGILMAALCRYYNDALAVPVRKMHGITVIRAMLEEGGYGRIWHGRRSDKPIETRAEALGWAKGELDELLFGRLVTAIEQHRLIIHSATLWQQMGQYIYDDQGRICHQALASIAVEERKRHGDRVVGTALSWRGILDLPAWRNEKKIDAAPKGSLNWRRQQRGVEDAEKQATPFYMR